MSAKINPVESVSIWPASASKASEPAMSPPITSTISTALVITSTTMSRFRCSPVAVTSWLCWRPLTAPALTQTCQTSISARYSLLRV